VDRRNLLWTLVAFFGAGLVFFGVRQATEGESAIVVLGAQLIALAAIIGLVVVLVRRQG
jgi:hypothetical protein